VYTLLAFLYIAVCTGVALARPERASSARLAAGLAVAFVCMQFVVFFTR
jgi:hypothetical protein